MKKNEAALAYAKENSAIKLAFIAGVDWALKQSNDIDSCLEDKIIPEHFEQHRHSELINNLFDKGQSYSHTGLNKKICKHFKVSDHVGRRFIIYYQVHNYILNVSRRVRYHKYIRVINPK